jgi:hypothetical protein
VVSRYKYLAQEISRTEPCSVLVEIGTWNGKHAVELARAALRRNASVTYYGFDLFELLTESDLKSELSKRPPPLSVVEATLADFQQRMARRPWWRGGRRTFNFELHKGYTRDTLPAFYAAQPDFAADFVFIDGGHHVDTIENDWHWTSKLVRPGGKILLDDYYDNAELSEKFGCNRLVSRLLDAAEWKISILPEKDYVPNMGSIQIVKAECLVK